MTIYAYTSIGDYRAYPQYISVTRGDDGSIVVSVRSPERPKDGYLVPGEQASCTLTEKAVAELAAALGALQPKEPDQ